MSKYTSYVVIEERDYSSGEIVDMKALDVNAIILEETGEKPDVRIVG